VKHLSLEYGQQVLQERISGQEKGWFLRQKYSAASHSQPSWAYGSHRGASMLNRGAFIRSKGTLLPREAMPFLKSEKQICPALCITSTKFKHCDLSLLGL
jgi:hypothetical protein